MVNHNSNPFTVFVALTFIGFSADAGRALRDKTSTRLAFSAFLAYSVEALLLLALIRTDTGFVAKLAGLAVTVFLAFVGRTTGANSKTFPAAIGCTGSVAQTICALCLSRLAVTRVAIAVLRFRAIAVGRTEFFSLVNARYETVGVLELLALLVEQFFSIFEWHFVED